MFVEERHDEILQMLNDSAKVTVSELARRFSVSEVTIRKDLKTLEEESLLKRTHGGAIINNSLEDVPSINSRRIIKKEIKEKIGLKTAEFIRNNETIMLDAGTTTLEVAKNLSRFNNLIVVSNSLEICNLLTKFKGIKAVATGGEINKDNLSMRGSIGIQVLSQYTANKAIMGAVGLSLKHGLTVSSELVSKIKRQMIESAKEVIVVADSTKFDNVSFSPVCDLEEIDIIITDQDIPEEYMYGLKERNIKIYTV